MKYRRRIVYLDDPLWRKLALIAKDRNARSGDGERWTISSTIRDLILDPVEGEMLMWSVYQRDMQNKVVHHIDGDASNLDPDNLELRDAK